MLVSVYIPIYNLIMKSNSYLEREHQLSKLHNYFQWYSKELYFLFFFSFIFISWRLITSQHFSGFCQTLT